MDFQIEDSSSITDSVKNEKRFFEGSKGVKDELLKCISTIPNFIARLSYFALKHIRLYFFSSTIRGECAVEVVQQVIEKVLSLERKWYRERQPDFANFLRLAIFSYIRNEFKKKIKIEFVGFYDDEGREIEEFDKEYVNRCIRADLDNPIFENSCNSIIERFKNFIKNDTTAFMILDCELKGIRKHNEIAAELKIDIKEVRKGIKRLKRGFERFQRKGEVGIRN